jgi:alpha-tubulin suppressor-like RCC1 family protein
VDGSILVPVRFTQVAAGNGNGYGLTDDGTVYSWGGNTYGQLGNGSATSSNVPVAMDGTPWKGKTITQIASGGTTAYALTNDGKVYAWGDGQNGQLGDGLSGAGNCSTKYCSTTPMQISALDGKQIRQVVGTNNNGYALADDGTVYSWGGNTFSQLGTSALTTGYQPPAPVVYGAFPWTAPTTKIVQIATGGNSAFALGADGTVYAWGSGTNGALGNGTTAASKNPVVVSGASSWTVPATRIVQIAAGNYGGYALGTDGTVYAWGLGTSGQLGDGKTITSNTPVVVSGAPSWTDPGTKIIQIAAGATSSAAYALASDGSVFGWGNGILGDNSTTSVTHAVPFQVVGTGAAMQVTQVSVGAIVAFAIVSDGDGVPGGAAYAWGSGTGSALGTGSTLPQGAPYPVLAPLVNSGKYLWYPVPGLAPIDTVTVGAWTTRSYRVGHLDATAGGVRAGGSRTMVVTATFLQPMSDDVLSPALDKVVVSQAWVDSSVTPIAGLLPSGLTRPVEPIVPIPSAFGVPGVPGNATCNTDADSNSQVTTYLSRPAGVTEDSCDQVPALVPAINAKPSSLSGSSWVDSNKNGLRDADELSLKDVTVTLLRGDVVYGSATTGSDGTYRFSGLPAGDYQVQFGVSDLNAGAADPLNADPAKWNPTYAFTRGSGSPASGDAAVQAPGDASDSVVEAAYTVDVNAAAAAGARGLLAGPLGVGGSAADPDTGLAGPYTLGVGEDLTDVDAGVAVYGPAFMVDKTSSAVVDGGQVSIASATTLAPALPVTATFTNIGDEPLTDFTWADVTDQGPDGSDLGPDVTGWSCAPSVTTALVLQPGESITCAGTLPSRGPGVHQDTATIKASGAFTNRNVTGADDFTVTTLVARTIYVHKTGVNGGPLAGAAFVVYPSADDGTALGTPDGGTPIVIGASVIPSPDQSWFGSALAAGDYWLTETKAPAGHELLVSQVPFTVGMDGTVSLRGAVVDYPQVTVTSSTSSSGIDTIQVADVSSLRLPWAGGPGFHLIEDLAGAFLAFLLAGIIAVTMRRTGSPGTPHHARATQGRAGR